MERGCFKFITFLKISNILLVIYLFQENKSKIQKERKGKKKKEREAAITPHFCPLHMPQLVPKVCLQEKDTSVWW